MSFAHAPLEFAYGAGGQRISKQVGGAVGDPGTYREHYIRDAQGNVMATYRLHANGAFRLQERPIYGSSRVGLYAAQVDLYPAGQIVPMPQVIPVFDGLLRYELNDHLGNVGTVVTGRLLPGQGAPHEAEVIGAQGYEPFGALLPGRNYSSGSYRYLFQGQEHDDEINGATGTSYAFEARMHDARVGRFLSIDPLAAKYPHNSPYAFSENRVIDGLELEGLEYISFHHYADGSVAKTEFYKMTAKDIVRLGGTTAGLHNSVPFGPGGKGVVHQYYNSAGERVASLWEQRQTGGASDVRFHGLYSGPGCVTVSGIPNNEDYNFSEQPIDWSDAIAKRHDMDYADVVAGGEPYAGYLEDVRTVQADRDMVRRIDEVTSAFLGDRPWGEIEGLETPVRTSYSGEMDASMLGQRLVINALATYKQWKLDNGLGNADL